MNPFLFVSTLLHDDLVRAQIDRARAIRPVVRFMKRIEPDVVLGGENRLRWEVDGRYVICTLTKPGGKTLMVSLRRTDLKPWILKGSADLSRNGAALSLTDLQDATSVWRRRVYPEVTEWATGKCVFGDSKDEMHRRWFTEGAAPRFWRDELPKEIQVKVDVVRGGMEVVLFVWPDQSDYIKKKSEPSFLLPPLDRDLRKIDP